MWLPWATGFCDIQIFFCLISASQILTSRRITEHLENPIKAFFLLSKKKKTTPVSGGPQFYQIPFRGLKLRTATQAPLVSVNTRMSSASCLARVVRVSSASEQASPQLICRDGRGPGLGQPAVLEKSLATSVQEGRALRLAGWEPAL